MTDQNKFLDAASSGLMNAHDWRSVRNATLLLVQHLRATTPNATLTACPKHGLFIGKCAQCPESIAVAVSATTPNAAGREEATSDNPWRNKLEQLQGIVDSNFPAMEWKDLSDRKARLELVWEFVERARDQTRREFAEWCQREFAKPAEVEVSDDQLRNVYAAAKYSGTKIDDDAAIRAVYEAGRSSAARELSERDARIAELLGELRHIDMTLRGSLESEAGRTDEGYPEQILRRGDAMVEAIRVCTEQLRPAPEPGAEEGEG